MIVPPGPVAVAVYVVLAVGETSWVPVGTGTLPTPLSMLMEVALVAVQLRVDFWPAMIEVGEAEKVRVGAGCVTVTVADALAVPPGPLAVAVYVVVVVGTTAWFPESGSACWSSCGSAGEIVIEVAPVLVHCKVLNWPAVTVAGVAVSVMVGAAAGAGVGVCGGLGVCGALGGGALEEEAVPPHAVRIPTSTMATRNRKTGLR